MSSMTWNHKRWTNRWWAMILNQLNIQIFQLKIEFKFTLNWSILQKNQSNNKPIWMISTKWVNKRWMNRWWVTNPNPLRHNPSHRLSQSSITTTLLTLTKTTNTRKAHQSTNMKSIKMTKILTLTQKCNQKWHKLTLRKFHIIKKPINNKKKINNNKTSTSSMIWNRRKWMIQWWAMNHKHPKILIISTIRLNKNIRILWRWIRILNIQKVKISINCRTKMYMKSNKEKRNTQNPFNRL
jgi:hypothetical protein